MGTEVLGKTPITSDVRMCYYIRSVRQEAKE